MSRAQTPWYRKSLISRETSEYYGPYVCRDCGEDVPIEVDSLTSRNNECPHCGFQHPEPVRHHRSRFGLYGLVNVLGTVFLVGIFWMWLTIPLMVYHYVRLSNLMENEDNHIGKKEKE